MTSEVETTRPAANSFGRGFGIGLFGHLAIVLLLVGGVFLAARLGGEGGATAAGLSFIPALALLDALYLVVVLIVVAVPALRIRIGSGPGLLLGWLVGVALVTGAVALLFSLN